MEKLALITVCMYACMYTKRETGLRIKCSLHS